MGIRFWAAVRLLVARIYYRCLRLRQHLPGQVSRRAFGIHFGGHVAVYIPYHGAGRVPTGPAVCQPSREVSVFVSCLMYLFNGSFSRYPLPFKCRFYPRSEGGIELLRKRAAQTDMPHQRKCTIHITSLVLFDDLPTQNHILKGGNR